VSLSGLLFEATPEAVRLSLGAPLWTANRAVIAVGDFQKALISQYGCLIDAWRKAFDGERTGVINFTVFGKGCKAAGFSGDVTRLWGMFDIDHSGEIGFKELATDPAKFEVKCVDMF